MSYTKTLISCIVLSALKSVAAAETASINMFAGNAINSNVQISGDGTTLVGWDRFNLFDSKAFRWSKSEGLHLFDLPQGTRSMHATAVSYDGSVIVGNTYADSSASSSPIPFKWSMESGIQNLQGFSYGSATGVSGHGQTIVGSSIDQTIPGNQFNAFRWTESNGTHLLGASDEFSSARGVSANGSVIAGQVGNEGLNWHFGVGLIDIGDLPGGESDGTVAFAVSADGGTLVGRSFSAQGEEAFRWTAETGIIGLGGFSSPPQSSFLSSARDVSGDGSVVVGQAFGASRNFIWDSVHGTRSISTILEGYGLDLTGIDFGPASAVSDDGLTIVFPDTMTPQGNMVAVVSLSAIPEPTPIILVISSLILMSGRRSRV